MPTYSFVLNGESVSVDVPGDIGLLYVMRDLLGVTGPKYGCGVGVCRACTCHLNGEEFQPCVTPISMVEGQDVTSIEGLADGDTLHPLQEAWIDFDVAQCGYCQPGQIMTAAALLDSHRDPTDADIDGIENICRCGTYFRIRSAIKQAAAALAPGSGNGNGNGKGKGKDRGGDSQGEDVAVATAGVGESNPQPAAAADQSVLPATGAGVGAAALIASAAAAVAKGREEVVDRLE